MNSREVNFLITEAKLEKSSVIKSLVVKISFPRVHLLKKYSKVVKSSFVKRLGVKSSVVLLSPSYKVQKI